MYTVTKPELFIRGHGCPDRFEPAETRTFTTAAALLRWALDERVFEHRTGGRPYPKRFDQPYIGRYGVIDSFCRWKFTPELIEAMRRAQSRYRQIIHYLAEVEPEWRPDTTVSPTGYRSYADNSTELHEINKYGRRRHRMTDPPSGDACF